MRILDSIGVLIGADPAALVTGIQKGIDKLQRMQVEVDKTSGQMMEMGNVMSQLRHTILAIPPVVLGTKAVRAWAQEETSINNLNSALIVQNKWRKGLTQELINFSGAMQNSANVADDLVRDVIAMGLNMGMTVERAKELTKASIGMTKLSPMMRSPIMAMRMLMMAEQGQTAFLSRYGIMVDKTKSKQDQFKQVLQQSMRGFKIAQLELGTLTGQTIRFGLVTGDAMEALGQEINRTLRLTEVMRALGDGVQKLTNWFTSLSNRTRSLIIWIGVLVTAGLVLKPVLFLLSLLGKLLSVKLLGMAVGFLKVAKVVVGVVLPALLKFVAIAAIAAGAFTLGYTIRQVKMGGDTLGGHVDSFAVKIYERMRVLWVEQIPAAVKMGMHLLGAFLAEQFPSLTSWAVNMMATTLEKAAEFRAWIKELVGGDRNEINVQLAQALAKAEALRKVAQDPGGLAKFSRAEAGRWQSEIIQSEERYRRFMAEFDKKDRLAAAERLSKGIGSWDEFKNRFGENMLNFILFLKNKFGMGLKAIGDLLSPADQLWGGEEGKPPPQGLTEPVVPKLAGAFEKGSADAYKVIVGGPQKTLDKIAENTGKMVNLMQQDWVGGEPAFDL